MVVLNFMLSFRKHAWILTCYLSDHLAAQQRKRITIEGDGNCLFCAMAYAIYKTRYACQNARDVSKVSSEEQIGVPAISIHTS